MQEERTEEKMNRICNSAAVHTTAEHTQYLCKPNVWVSRKTARAKPDLVSGGDR